MPWPYAMNMLYGEEGTRVPTDALGLSGGVFIPKDHDTDPTLGRDRHGIFERGGYTVGDMSIGRERLSMAYDRAKDFLRGAVRQWQDPYGGNIDNGLMPVEIEISEDEVSGENPDIRMRYSLFFRDEGDGDYIQEPDQY